MVGVGRRSSSKGKPCHLHSDNPPVFQTHPHRAQQTMRAGGRASIGRTGHRVQCPRCIQNTDRRQPVYSTTLHTLLPPVERDPTRRRVSSQSV